MKISIVLPYFNRKQLLLNVLRSIEYYKNGHDIEVIVVDDGSEVKIDEFKCIFDINLITLDPHPMWRGAGMAYNAGFNAASGDVILINSSECVHAGDIIGYINDNLKPDSYMSFSAYRASIEVNEVIDRINWDNFVDLKYMPKTFGISWNTHSLYSLTYIPYCAALYKKDMDKLGGYDERFIGGIGYDDYDFTDRVKNLGLEMSLVDSPFCIHQWHTMVQNRDKTNINLLYKLRTEAPDRIMANKN